MTNKEAIEVIKSMGLIADTMTHGAKHKSIYNAIDLAIKALEDRPHGEWITIGEEQGALGIIYKIRKCSKCGWEHSLVIPDNFCPNCGADMRGGRE